MASDRKEGGGLAQVSRHEGPALLLCAAPTSGSTPAPSLGSICQQPQEQSLPHPLQLSKHRRLESPGPILGVGPVRVSWAHPGYGSITVAGRVLEPRDAPLWPARCPALDPVSKQPGVEVGGS